MGHAVILILNKIFYISTKYVSFFFGIAFSKLFYDFDFKIFNCTCIFIC